jgi:hypothetical protein
MGIIEQVREMKLEEARKKARKEGREQVNRLVVTNLLNMTSYSVARIAALTRVSEAYVKRIKASMKK